MIGNLRQRHDQCTCYVYDKHMYMCMNFMGKIFSHKMHKMYTSTCVHVMCVYMCSCIHILCVSAKQCPSPVTISTINSDCKSSISLGVLCTVSEDPWPVPLVLPNEYNYMYREREEDKWSKRKRKEKR